MSDFIEDMYSKIGDDESIEWNKYQPRITEKYSIKDNKDYWVTKGGKKLYCSEMTKEHIRATMMLIESNCKKNNLKPTNYKIYNLLEIEIKRR